MYHETANITQAISVCVLMRNGSILSYDKGPFKNVIALVLGQPNPNPPLLQVVLTPSPVCGSYAHILPPCCFCNTPMAPLAAGCWIATPGNYSDSIVYGSLSVLCCQGYETCVHVISLQTLSPSGLSYQELSACIGGFVR